MTHPRSHNNSVADPSRVSPRAWGTGPLLGLVISVRRTSLSDTWNTYGGRNRRTELVYSSAYILNTSLLSVKSSAVYIFTGILIIEAIHSRLWLLPFTKQHIDTGTKLPLLQAEHCCCSSREQSSNIRINQLFIHGIRGS